MQLYNTYYFIASKFGDFKDFWYILILIFVGHLSRFNYLFQTIPVHMGVVMHFKLFANCTKSEEEENTHLIK